MFVNWPERFFCNSPVRGFILRLQARKLLGLRPLAPGLDILEIGCGNGAGAAIVIGLTRPGSYQALDPDPAMLALARKRLADGPATVVHGDAQSLPFEDNSFDAVFNFGIIHHLEDWRAGIAEVARVLKPGGAFYIEEIFPGLYANAVLRHVVAHPTRDRFHAPEFINQLAQSGFSLLPGGHKSAKTMLGVALLRKDS